ncbi:MAG: 2-oxo acid dehydrogenase subunit E2 [Eubacteriales bacterium]|nr:2-oxo acid dehydrogenase subunit E2 [Eubacteriales bacterium]
MAEKVIMPKQGLQMTEGTITRWFVKEGGNCVSGQPLFEMETDKLVITIDANVTGKLLKILALEGSTVPITETIAIIGQEGEDTSALLAQEKPSQANTPAMMPVSASAQAAGLTPMPVAAPAGPVYATPRAKLRAEEKNLNVEQIPGSGPDGLIIERDVLAFIPQKATPLAKAIAQQEGVNVSDAVGSGAHGKVTRADVNALIAARKDTLNTRHGTLVPYEGKRKMIGDKMQESLRTHAQLSHQIKVDMSRAVELRESFKAADRKVSYNDFILMATARALMDFPAMNAELTDKGILQKDYVHLGMAVDVPSGLIVPVIRDADLMRLGEISACAAELADKAKNGKLLPTEYTGSSFTVTNLGMFGLECFVPILNTPESGILGVGKIEKQAVVINDEIVIRPMMCLTLTYDHRVTDGAPAAQFLARVKQYLENPFLLL